MHIRRPENAMNLTTEQARMLRQIVVFYRHHHMSASNPQQCEVDLILDKIGEDIASKVERDRDGG